MKKTKVIIQGIEGSFHHIAAATYFNNNLCILPQDSFHSLVQKTIEAKGEYYGIIAIENAIAGSLLQNYGLLQNANLNVEGEIYINIKQNLLSLPGTKLNEITEIRTHSMAIQQCMRYIRRNLPKVKIVETPDTAQSAKEIAQKRCKGIATIASKMAAELFGLEIVTPRIETIKNNQTRFFILSPKKNKCSDFDKASLYFKTTHEVGSLYKVLEQISLQNINLSKLQSFPIMGQSWQYFFHADLEFSDTGQYFAVLEKIKPLTQNLTILGKYKRGIRVL